MLYLLPFLQGGARKRRTCLRYTGKSGSPCDLCVPHQELVPTLIPESNHPYLNLDLVIAHDGLGDVVDAYIARSVVTHSSHGGQLLDARSLPPRTAGNDLAVIPIRWRMIEHAIGTTVHET